MKNVEIREEILEHNRKTGESIEAYVQKVDEAIAFLQEGGFTVKKIKDPRELLFRMNMFKNAVAFGFFSFLLGFCVGIVVCVIISMG